MKTSTSFGLIGAKDITKSLIPASAFTLCWKKREGGFYYSFFYLSSMWLHCSGCYLFNGRTTHEKGAFWFQGYLLLCHTIEELSGEGHVGQRINQLKGSSTIDAFRYHLQTSVSINRSEAAPVVDSAWFRCYIAVEGVAWWQERDVRG